MPLGIKYIAVYKASNKPSFLEQGTCPGPYSQEGAGAGPTPTLISSDRMAGSGGKEDLEMGRSSSCLPSRLCGFKPVIQLL